MLLFSHWSRPCFLTLICTGLPLAHAATPTPNETYPTLTQYGQVHANSCSAPKKAALRATLAEFQIPDPAQAWRLIDTLLCAEKTMANQRLIRNAMAKTVKALYEGTGQDPFHEVLKPSDDNAERLMAGGSAWDAGLDPKKRENSVRLYYYTDEVTISGSTITYRKGRWLITEHGSASD